MTGTQAIDYVKIETIYKKHEYDLTKYELASIYIQESGNDRLDIINTFSPWKHGVSAIVQIQNATNEIAKLL